MYHYFYKITNNINGHFYYGAHSTNNLNDNYFGSGIKLKEAIKKYGKENFSKEILKYFDTREELSEYELQIVNEDLIKSKECYNICPGGLGSFNKNLIIVKDLTSNNFKFISKEEFDLNKDKYESYNKGKVIVKDENGNIKRVNVNDEDYLNGKLKHISENTVVCKINGINKRVSKQEYIDNNYDFMFKNMTMIRLPDGSLKYVTCEEFKNNSDLISAHKGFVTVKDKEGNTFRVNKNDPKYLTGEYEYMFKDTKNFVNKITGEVKRLKLNDELLKTGEWKGQNVGKMIYKDKNGKNYKCYKDDPRVLSGELVPNQLGNKHSEETKKKIGKFGKGKIWINNGIINKFIKPEEFENYPGFIKGFIKYNKN